VPAALFRGFDLIQTFRSQRLTHGFPLHRAMREIRSERLQAPLA
jgi:hypothetical protein